MPNSSINQSGATAGGNIVAGDLHLHNYGAASPRSSVIEQLLAKLQKEIENNAQVRAMIESLRYYHEHKSVDGISGLEAKLNKSNRAHEINHALEKKELFVKLIDKWSMYASAQEIFVHLLARAEHEFSSHVLPQIDSLTEVEINDAISQKIVTPIVSECGATPLQIHHGVAKGMIYWLAEQCFVRWHK